MQDQVTTEVSDTMRRLTRLLGTWRVEGGAPGTVTYEQVEGGHFLVQRIALEQGGEQVVGFEVIGHLRPFGEERSEHVHSRFYDSTGSTLDYIYELEGDDLWIWAGERGSPAHFHGTFSADDEVVSGAWVYPGGGGYESTMTRVDGPSGRGSAAGGR